MDPEYDDVLAHIFRLRRFERNRPRSRGVAEAFILYTRSENNLVERAATRLHQDMRDIIRSRVFVFGQGDFRFHPILIQRYLYAALNNIDFIGLARQIFWNRSPPEELEDTVPDLVQENIHLDHEDDDQVVPYVPESEPTSVVDDYEDPYPGYGVLNFDAIARRNQDITNLPETDQFVPNLFHDSSCEDQIVPQIGSSLAEKMETVRPEYKSKRSAGNKTKISAAAGSNQSQQFRQRIQHPVYNFFCQTCTCAANQVVPDVGEKHSNMDQVVPTLAHSSNIGAVMHDIVAIIPHIPFFLQLEKEMGLNLLKNYLIQKRMSQLNNQLNPSSHHNSLRTDQTTPEISSGPDFNYTQFQLQRWQNVGSDVTRNRTNLRNFSRQTYTPFVSVPQLSLQEDQIVPQIVSSSNSCNDRKCMHDLVRYVQFLLQSTPHRIFLNQLFTQEISSRHQTRQMISSVRSNPSTTGRIVPELQISYNTNSLNNDCTNPYSRSVHIHQSVAAVNSKDSNEAIKFSSTSNARTGLNQIQAIDPGNQRYNYSPRIIQRVARLSQRSTSNTTAYASKSEKAFNEIMAWAWGPYASLRNYNRTDVNNRTASTFEESNSNQSGIIFHTQRINYSERINMTVGEFRSNSRKFTAPNSGKMSARVINPLKLGSWGPIPSARNANRAANVSPNSIQASNLNQASPFSNVNERFDYSSRISQKVPELPQNSNNNNFAVSSSSTSSLNEPLRSSSNAESNVNARINQNPNSTISLDQRKQDYLLRTHHMVEECQDSQSTAASNTTRTAFFKHPIVRTFPPNPLKNLNHHSNLLCNSNIASRPIHSITPPTLPVFQTQYSLKRTLQRLPPPPYNARNNNMQTLSRRISDQHRLIASCSDELPRNSYQTENFSKSDNSTRSSEHGTISREPQNCSSKSLSPQKLGIFRNAACSLPISRETDRRNNSDFTSTNSDGGSEKITVKTEYGGDSLSIPAENACNYPYLEK